MSAPAPPPEAGPSARGRSVGIASAAAAIGVVTVAARLLGFGRVVVFSHTVGTATCLGSAYYTANTVPNLLFEVVVGGALASVVVPVLAGAVERGDTDTASRTASALLGWSLLVLAPLALVAAALARPVMELLYAPQTGGCSAAAVVEVGTRMLLVFAPQVVLYGVAVVLTGVLQAHRHFLGPALAPLLSSLVVIAAYLLYGARSAGRPEDLRTLPLGRELILSVGTTLGVAALALPLLLPLRRTGLRLRLSLEFPPGVAARVRHLALAGAAALAAQQLSAAVVLRLANGYAPLGGIVLYTLAWTLFLVPWAVLAVPIATSAFPALAGRADAGDDAGYADVAARATRAVVLVTALAAAALAAAALPAARVLVAGTRGSPDPTELARAIAAFAPGLVGYGLVAHLSRTLYARGAGRAAATATVVGWLGVVLADVALVPAAAPGWVVGALGAGNTVGMTLAALLLLVALHRGTDGAGLAGLPRAAGAGLLGALAAWGAGASVARALGPHGVLGGIADCAAVGVVVAAVFAAVVLLADGRDLRAVLARRYAGG